MPQAIKCSRCKGSSGQNWEKCRKYRHGQLTKFRNKKEVVDEARKKGRKAHFRVIDGSLSSQEFGVRTSTSKVQRERVVLRGDTVKDDSGSYAVFAEQGSSASQMTAAKVMDIISRIPGCAGQASDAVSANTQVKVEGAPTLLKIPKSECLQIFGNVYKNTNGQNHGPVWKTQVFLLSEICMVIFWQDCQKNGNLRKVLLKYGWEKFQIVNAHSLTEKMCILIRICGRCQTGRKETEHQTDLENSHEIR